MLMQITHLPGLRQHSGYIGGVTERYGITVSVCLSACVCVVPVCVCRACMCVCSVRAFVCSSPYIIVEANLNWPCLTK